MSIQHVVVWSERWHYVQSWFVISHVRKPENCLYFQVHNVWHWTQSDMLDLNETWLNSTHGLKSITLEWKYVITICWGVFRENTEWRIRFWVNNYAFLSVKDFLEYLLIIIIRRIIFDIKRLQDSWECSDKCHLLDLFACYETGHQWTNYKVEDFT